MCVTFYSLNLYLLSILQNTMEGADLLYIQYHNDYNYLTICWIDWYKIIYVDIHILLLELEWAQDFNMFILEVLQRFWFRLTNFLDVYDPSVLQEMNVCLHLSMRRRGFSICIWLFVICICVLVCLCECVRVYFW